MNNTGLTIDLNALVKNYHTAKNMAADAITACVVKANAYGLGVEPIAKALARAGAKVFFVASVEEGIALRKILKEVDIYVFNGLQPPDSVGLFLENNLRPCLNSAEEIKIWSNISLAPKPALHIDTGINRLGISIDELKSLNLNLKLALIMSHLSCADTPKNPMNQIQYKKFYELARKYPDIAASLSNSAGLFLGTKFNFQMTRIGIALYGGFPLETPLESQPFEPVVFFKSWVAQIRDIKAGEKVGYGASFVADKDSKIAIIPTGYADGYPRNVSNATVYIEGIKAPIIGRISMDMLIADITDCGQSIAAGSLAELLGNKITISNLAKTTNTIPHAIITGLGSRQARHYIGG